MEVLASTNTTREFSVPAALKLRLMRSTRSTSTSPQAAQDRRAAVLEHRQRQARQVTLKAKKVAKAARQTECTRSDLLQQQVDTKLQQAEERRTDLLRSQVARAAARNAQVGEAVVNRNAQSTLLEKEFKQQEMKAASLRESSLQTKRRKLAAHGKRVEAVCKRVTAARLLQLWWRTRANSSSKRFKAAQPSIEALLEIDAECKSGEFEGISKLLRSKKALVHAK